MRCEPIKRPNKSLDASGGGVFRNSPGAAEGALTRAAASTLPLGAYNARVICYARRIEYESIHSGCGEVP